MKIFHKTLKLRSRGTLFFLLTLLAKKEWEKCLKGKTSQPLQWSVSLESLVRYRRIMHGYSHPKLSPNSEHSDNTSTLPIPVENKGTTRKQCAAKSNGVWITVKKTENKQNDNVLRIIHMHDNIQAAEWILIQRILSLCSIGALMRGK